MRVVGFQLLAYISEGRGYQYVISRFEERDINIGVALLREGDIDEKGWERTYTTHSNY